MSNNNTSNHPPSPVTGPPSFSSISSSTAFPPPVPLAPPSPPSAIPTTTGATGTPPPIKDPYAKTFSDVIQDNIQGIKNSRLFKKVKREKPKSKEETETTSKFPNTLIIYIKTRIPNFYKFTYKPSMSIPNIKFNTVLFNPLVKYNSSIVNQVPEGAPPQVVMTQFFETNQFQTLINRTLSNFSTMQPKRTLAEATNEGIVDNNIEIVLNALFKNNNVIYLGNKPYTILDRHWNKGNWQIDTKPIDKLITPFSHLTGNELQTAQSELDEIDEEIRQGNAASSNLVEKILKEGLNSSLNQDNNQKNVPFLLQKKNDDKNETEDDYILFKEHLKDCNPINFYNNLNKSNDPITLSLLIDNEQLIEFINKNISDSQELIKYYQAIITNKEKIKEQELIIKNKINHINDYKYKYKKEILEHIKLFREYTININNGETINNKKKKEIIAKITELKIDYFKIIFELLEDINNIFIFQREYFESVVNFLEILKDKYSSIINYEKDKTPELAIKCIDNDIETYNLMIIEDEKNIFSKIYFVLINAFNICYNKFKTFEDKLLDTDVNYIEEFEKYIYNRNLLYIEDSLYEVYIYNILRFYFENQRNIWFLSYNTLNSFINNIFEKVKIRIARTCQTFDAFFNNVDNTKFAEETQKNSTSIQSSVVNRKIEWFFADKNGNRIYKRANKREMNNVDVGNLMKQKELVDIIRLEVDSYDGIILYSYLLEIACLKKTYLFISQENLFHILLESKNVINVYLTSIIDSQLRFINGDKTKIFIPFENFLGEKDIIKDNINNINFIEDKIKNENNNIKSLKEKNYDIGILIQKIEDHCLNIYNLVDNEISKRGIEENCKSILDGKNVLSEYSLVDFNFLQYPSKYDIEKTTIFNYEISSLIIYLCNEQIMNIYHPLFFQDWIVHKSNSDPTLNLFETICHALNSQLELTNSITDNIYTSSELNSNGENKKVFTPASLKKLVSENFDKAFYEYYMDHNDKIKDGNLKNLLQTTSETEINDPTIFAGLIIEAQNIILRDDYVPGEEAFFILQKVLEINFILFENIVQSTININDLVIYRKELYKIIEIDTSDKIKIFNNNKIISNINKNDIQVFNLNIKCNNVPARLNNRENYVYSEYIFLYKTLNNSATNYQIIRNINILKGIYVYDYFEIPDYLIHFMYKSCYQIPDSNIVEQPKDEGDDDDDADDDEEEFTSQNVGTAAQKAEEVGSEKAEVEEEAQGLGTAAQGLGTETQKAQEVGSEKVETQNVGTETQGLGRAKEVESQNIYKQNYVRPKNTDRNVRTEDSKQVNSMKADLKTLNKQYKKKENKLKDDPDDKTLKENVNNIDIERKKLEIEIRELEKKITKTQQKGGADKQRPRDEYYNSRDDYSSFFPFKSKKNYNHPGYNPSYNQGYYHPRFNHPIPPSMFRYIPPPENANIESKYFSNKNNSSKLSYYITIDLDLYPGKSVSALQKYSVKCQTAFEKIRESYAELFGYEYRPAVLSEAYAYNYQKKEVPKTKEKKIEKKGGSTNKKSVKNKSYKNKSKSKKLKVKIKNK